MATTAVLGVAFGDEGKANIEVFILEHGLYLPAGERYQAVARYHGGANAGESYEHRQLPREIVISHQVPVGIGYPGVYTAFLSGGMIHPQKLVEEIFTGYEAKDADGTPRRIPGLVELGIEVSARTYGISGRNQVVLLHHLAEEAEMEGGGQTRFDTTKTGIGPGYAHAAYKIGMTFAEFVGPNFEAILAERVLPALRKKFGEEHALKAYRAVYAEPRELLRQFLRREDELVAELEGANLLLCGCQSVGLDVFNGANRYSSSSVTTRLPFDADVRIGVLKLIQSAVGDRRSTGNRKWITYDERVTKALVGETDDDGVERGKTSGRLRALGFLDAVLGRHSMRVGRINRLAVTKLDRMAEFLKLTNGVVPVATAYRYRGSELRELPEDSWVLEECEPVYEEFRVGEDLHLGKRLRELREFSELSPETQGFFKRLEERLGAQIDIISTGPWTEDKIVRR